MIRVEQVIPSGAAKPVHVAVVETARLTEGPELDAIRDAILSLDADKTGIDLLIDLGQAEFLSSAALGMLGMVHRKTWGSKGRLKLCNVRPDVLQIFRITKLDSLFDIHATRDEAVADF